MPHEYILLDPPGYKRCDEPGFHWYINGSSLLAKICHPDGCAPVPATRLFNPAKSDWLLPRPLQFEPDWLKDRDTILHLYVLKESDWTFSPEITLKALSYFDDGDLRELPEDLKSRLVTAVREVDLDNLPSL